MISGLEYTRRIECEVRKSRPPLFSTLTVGFAPAENLDEFQILNSWLMKIEQIIPFAFNFVNNCLLSVNI